MNPLMKSIDEFYKYYQEQNKDKIKIRVNLPHFIKEGSDEKNNFNTHYKSVFGLYNHKIKKKIYEITYQGLWWENIPSMFSDKSIWDYAKSKDLQPLNVSYGRVGGKEDGEVVYIVTYWVITYTKPQSMSTVKTLR